MGNSPKVCVICGEDCSDRPRTKDSKERYCFRDCYEAAAKRQEAQPQVVSEGAPPEPPDHVFDKMTPPPAVACPRCDQPLAPVAVVCNCGFHRQLGQQPNRRRAQQTCLGEHPLWMRSCAMAGRMRVIPPSASGAMPRHARQEPEMGRRSLFIDAASPELSRIQSTALCRRKRVNLTRRA
jgi:hypothetical protein